MNDRPKAQIFGIEFSRQGMDEIVEELVRPPELSRNDMRLVVTANVDHIVNLRRMPAFRAAYQAAHIRTIDGAPLMAYARFRGVDIPERVTGADLAPQVLERLRPDCHRIFFLAANPDVARLLKERLFGRGFTHDAVHAVVPPFGFENDTLYCEQLLDRIESARSTHLFLGVGAPKSEVFVFEHRDRLKGVKILCVGAALEFYVGAVKRAPRLLQLVGFEWIWRLASNPKRLWRRYLFGGMNFGFAVWEDVRGRWPT